LNHIVGVASSTSATSTVSGIVFGGTLSGGTVDRNEIRDIKQNNAAGGGSNGILANATTTTSSVVVSNNFISDIASIGSSGFTSADNGYGVMIDSGAGYKFYHNTVRMNTSQTSAGSVTAAINISSAVNAPGGLDIRDNIFANSDLRRLKRKYLLVYRLQRLLCSKCWFCQFGGAVAGGLAIGHRTGSAFVCGRSDLHGI
jgi:hypothetical protein